MPKKNNQILNTLGFETIYILKILINTFCKKKVAANKPENLCCTNPFFILIHFYLIIKIKFNSNFLIIF
jgi:hypothetical protein